MPWASTANAKRLWQNKHVVTNTQKQVYLPQLDAEGDKGVNTANISAVLLFWPAAVGNYMDADKAEELVEKRRTHLMGLYTSKGCAG